MAGRTYILFYNLVMVLGWGSVLLALPIQWVTSPQARWRPYSNPLIGLFVRVFQTLMLLDVVHAALRLTRTSPVTALMQVISRVWLVWGVLQLNPRSDNSLTLLAAWGLAEVIRYVHYIQVDQGPVSKDSKLLYLRYSSFIILYPIGVTSEMLCLRDAWAVIERCCPRVFSLEMPNALNFAFDYRWFILYVVLPAYVIFFPCLYMHMFRQRRNKLLSKEE